MFTQNGETGDAGPGSSQVEDQVCILCEEYGHVAADCKLNQTEVCAPFSTDIYASQMCIKLSQLLNMKLLVFQNEDDGIEDIACTYCGDDDHTETVCHLKKTIEISKVC